MKMKTNTNNEKKQNTHSDTAHPSSAKTQVHNRKKIRRITVLCALLLVVIIVVLAIIRFLNSGKEGQLYDQYLEKLNEPLPEYTYIFAPDFEEDIFQDQSYLDQDRMMHYTDGAETILLDLETDLSAYDDSVQFFKRYFNDVIHGNCTDYEELFWGEYYDDATSMAYPENPFTMQKLYDIRVEKKDETVGDGVTRLYYSVSYRFMDNNGSFRNDVRDGEARELIFQLLTTDGETRISQIHPAVTITIG